MSDLENLLQSSGRSSSVLGAIANPAQVNVLGAYGAAAETAGKIYGVQDLQAQKAWGEALQQSTGPDGVTDYQKASAIAAQNPLAAMGMMKGLTGSTALSGAVQTQGTARNQMLTDAMSSALNAPDDQLHDAVVAGTQKLVASGALTQEQAHRALLNMPSDPAQLRTQMERNRIALLPPVMQQPAIYGQPGSQTGPGGETVGTRQSVQTSTVTPAQPSGTGVPGGMDAKQLDAPYPYKDANGNPQVTTWREILTKSGIPIPTIPAAGGTKGLPDTLRVNPNKATPGGATPPPANGAQPAPNQPAPTTPAGPVSMPIGPAPGMEEKWKASADQYTADTAQAGQYQQRIFPLVQGRALLEGGDVTTGAGAEWVNHVKSLLQTAATQIPGLHWDAQTIAQADFDKLNKYLTQYTNSLPMAGASDARLASAITGNPSAHISTLANKDVVKALIGLERMKQTAITDFKAQGGQPNQYADYLVSWQNSHDPRAFVFDMLKDEDRVKMIKGMSPTERKSFNDTLTLVERNPGIMGQAAMPQH